MHSNDIEPTRKHIYNYYLQEDHHEHIPLHICKKRAIQYYWNYIFCQHLVSKKLYLKRLFSPWCFTHQYKNTTQFYFYAALLPSQNTKSQITLLKAGIYVSNSITLQEIYDCKKSGRIIIENQSKLAPSYGSGILLYSSSTSFKVLMADDDSGSLYFWFCSNRKASDKMVDAVSVVKII